MTISVPRVGVFSAGVDTTYAYDAQGRLISKHTERKGFRPIAPEVDGELSYIVTDHLGTPKELLSEEGELRWSASHKLRGRLRTRNRRRMTQTVSLVVYLDFKDNSKIKKQDCFIIALGITIRNQGIMSVVIRLGYSVG